MKWKLIIQLSIFGLIMAFATISLISERMEPPFWFMTFAFSAYVIAKVAPGKYFLHGFMVSLVNCFWITLVHLFFYDNYAAHHPIAVGMYQGIHPRWMMILFGPAFGVIFGIIQGLFAFLASKLVTKNPEE